MNPILAAGLFDNPWIVAAIIIGGALINWLSQRRQAKQQEEAERQPEGDSPSPKKAPGEFDMEETLRRLLGENVPPPVPATPPVPRAPRGQRPPPPERKGVPTPPPVRTWMEDAGDAGMPAHLPPPIAVAPMRGRDVEFGESADQAAVHFEQLKEQGRHPAVASGRRRRSHAGAHSDLWRDRKSVRRAFVASLVFGPPKGLEP
jgi:hypothetical protein